MDFEDDFFGECEDCSAGSYDGERQNGNEGDLNSFNLRDPETAYLLWSDDAEELANPQNRKLKCSLCGYEFWGQRTNSCPVCYGTMLRENI
jgi:rubrerythrin